MATTDRLTDLVGVHRRACACTRCFAMPGCHMLPDRERVDRVLPACVTGSKVMLVGEAIGPGTQRISGLPYIQPDGQMSNTGRTLERFVRRFGYTIDPDGPGQYAYCTDLIRCLPLTADGRAVRRPTRQESANCAPFLEEEITVMRPQVLILFGEWAAKTFFERHLGRRVRRLADVVGGPYIANVAGVRLTAFALHHPSPQAARPQRMALYQDVGGAVAEILDRFKRWPA